MTASSDISKFILIEDVQLFRVLDDAGRTSLLHEGTVQNFGAGDIIFREGEPGDVFYLIKSGAVKVTTAMSGSPVDLATLERGSFFGEVAIVSGKPRTATAQAVKDLQVICFNKQLVDRIAGLYPQFRALLDAVILGRAHDTIEKLVSHKDDPETS